ncbi:MAG TPA: hypothetical protein VGF55_09700 [Gemmataceae bacterium]
MTWGRTLAGGGFAAALVLAAGWTSQPVAGQAPGTTAVERPRDNASFGQPAAETSPPAASLPADPSDPTRRFHSAGSDWANHGDGQIAQLARQYSKAAKADEKADIRKKLSEALGRQFDDLAGRQQKELEALERRVADLRALLKRRHDARDQIIDRRLDQVLREAEGLGWGTHSADPRASYFPPSAKPAPQRR